MQSTSVTTAPRPQVMSRSNDEIHARNMAEYAIELAEYEASPCRPLVEAVSGLACIAGTLGFIVGVPVVSAQVAGKFAWHLTAGASACCCAAFLLGVIVADLPIEPTHPDARSDSGGGYAGGS